MDIGLDGNWIAQNGADLPISGMGFTLTLPNGDVEAGTLAAAGGYMTFTRIGYSSETKEYELNYPELKIGDITYYHNSPSEPIDVEGTWFQFPGMAPAFIFYEGKRVKDENNKDTLAREGDYEYYGYFKGKYTISNRNLPDSSIMVLTATHIHAKNLWAEVFASNMPLNLQELFDFSLLEIPSTFEGLEDWWFTLDEVRNFFEAAADRTTDIVKRADIYELMEDFLWDYSMAGTYDYSTVFDPENPYTLTDMSGRPNKLTLLTGSTMMRFSLWNGKASDED
jgi:hypothetical protein